MRVDFDFPSSRPLPSPNPLDAPMPLAVSLMIKPPLAMAQRIDALRRRLGIARRYGVDRLHTTVLPLWDERSTPPFWRDLACQALHAFDADPFRVTFDRLHGNLLKGSKGLREARAFQRRLVGHLAMSGCRFPATGSTRTSR